IVEQVMEAARLIEKIFARQKGVAKLLDRVPPDDAASRMLMYRNQGPFCEAPNTESNPRCNALATQHAKRSGLYPAAIQADPKFCDVLAKRPDAEKLLHQFVAVGGQGDALVPVPYTDEYKAEMTAISGHLK